MTVAGRNKKCIFLGYFRTAVRKIDMVIKPVKNVFFTDRNPVFYYDCKSRDIQPGGFVPCIQMNTDANGHCPEREMLLSPYFQMLQTVVVEDTVIDTLARRPFTVYLPVLIRIPRDAGMEAEVTMVLYVDGAPIVSGGDIFLHGGRNLCGRILAGSGICAHLLWDRCPMGSFYARQGRGDALIYQK